MVAPGAALATQGSTGESTAETTDAGALDVANDGVQDSQVFEVTDDGQIGAWERAALTLRTDDTDAPTAVPVPETVQLEQLGSGNSFTSGNDGTESKSLIQEFDGDRNAMGVHTTGEQVTLSFRSDYATGGTYDDLNNQQNVDIVAARLTPEDGKGVPDNTDEAVDLLSDIDNANANASFEMLENGATLDGNGNIDVTQSYSPGHYVFFAAVHESGENGFETDSDKNISVDGDVTIIGMEQLSVQENPLTVTEPTDAEPGDSLTFEVDASDTFGPSEGVTHAVAVYDASTFEDARFDIVVDESALGTDFDYTTDAELEHSINTVNGVADVEDGLTVNGNDLSDGEVRRPVDASSAIDFFAEDAGVDSPQVNPITEGGADPSTYEQIDASVTAVNGANHVADVTVDTFENFSEGEYRYVVVSTLDDNESQVSTATGTVDLSTPTLSPSPSPGSGDDGSGGNDGQSGQNRKIAPPPTVSQGGTATTFVPRVRAGQRLVVNIPQPAPSPSPPAASLQQLTITPPGQVSNVFVRITPSEGPPEGTPALDRGTGRLGYLNVQLENFQNTDSTPGTFTFTVSEERLSELGASPRNVVMYRYTGGSYVPVETEYLGDGRYSATTPGFSVFAIATADPSVSVTDASLSSTSADAGESVDVSTTLENTGDVDGNVTLTVTANGEEVTSRTVNVGAGETTEETLTISRDQAGDYSVAVNGVSAGTLTVAGGASEEPGEGTDAPGEDGEATATGSSGPGFTAVSALVALLAAALIARRRS